MRTVLCEGQELMGPVIPLRHIHPLLGEGNGNSLQYSCLENPMDRGAMDCRLQTMGSRRVRDN